MKQKQKMQRIPLTQLNLTNRFLFDEVMEDPKTHQDVLSIILGKDIPTLDENVTEKEHRVSPLARSIRMDVFAIDEDNTVYNTEMQSDPHNDLPKRSRYYQSLMDTSLLEPGVISYNHLNDSYIIMIMTFDLFGDGKYQYTFRPECLEIPGYPLQDGTTRIFLNTKGNNDDEVSQELIDFLHYVENTTDKMVAKIPSERIQRIHKQVCKVRTNEQIGVKYMQAWEEKIYDRLEGKRCGKNENIISLVKKNLARDVSIKEISEFLEESQETIQCIVNAIQKHPDADAEDLYDLLYELWADESEE